MAMLNNQMVFMTIWLFTSYDLLYEPQSNSYSHESQALEGSFVQGNKAISQAGFVTLKSSVELKKSN
jgi:hypothetical protein